MEGKSNQTTCLNFVLYYMEQYAHHFGFLDSEVWIIMNLELRFLKMFLWGLAYWEDLEYDWHLRFAINTIKSKFAQLAKEFEVDFRCLQDQNQGMDFEVVIQDLEKVIRPLKRQIHDICIHLLGGTLLCTSSPFNLKKFGEYKRDTTSFIDLIQMNLRALQTSKLVAPMMKQQFALIQTELEEFGMPFDTPNRLFDFIPRTRAWLNRISCLTYLYWVDGNDESLTSIMETMLHVLLHETLPCTNFGVISSHLEPTMIPQLLSHHLDFFLRDLVLPAKGDIEILQEGLIFMLSFIMDPPDVDSKDRKIIWAQIYSTINEFSSLIYSIHSNQMKEENFKANIYDFMMRMDRVKGKVRGLFVEVPYSSQIASPNTNAIACFLSTLVVNLRSLLERNVNLFPCLKHLWESLCIELELFGPFLKNIIELLQDDADKAIKDLRRETMNMIYNVDYFTKICLLGMFSTWYGMIALPDVIENTKLLKIQINKLVEVNKMHKKKMIGDHEQAGGTNSLRPRGVEGTEKEIMSMGFKEIEENIINDLTRGRMSLTVISISGSGGQGKTTLAKRIYDDPNIQWRFQKRVWCYLSKDFHVKDILIQILFDNGKGGDASEFEMQDLVLEVWRSLKRKRYLIVLDDIWDRDAWAQLEFLFPDDNTRSRILFTSRNQDLASQVKANSIPHPLPLFCDEESWELVKKIVFGSTDCKEELVGIGNKIASYCKGLPLAVALIGGVLRRTECNVDSWNKVAENLKIHLSQEGCGYVLELSYRYLPDHLKPCFLYFAAFQRGKILRAKRLKLLWIGEGFANQDGETKASEEDLAMEYLKDLVTLGLVVVTQWSSAKGGIKFLNVHDFLYDLCLEKARENNFMHWGELNSDDERKIQFSNSLLKYNHHRLRISENDPFIMSNPIVAKRELPTSSLHCFLCISYASRELSLQFLESFRILTVLKLKLRIKEFPEVILSSICLRYLSLHFEWRIGAIPPTIANLLKLRTLIIKFHRCDATLLPFVMWNMMSLRHVDVEFARLDFTGFNLENSSKSNIESLGALICYEDYKTIADFLRKFPNLRKLKLCTDKRKILSIAGSLITQLDSLGFYFNGEFDENPHPVVWNFAEIPNLTKLKLDGTNIIPWSVLSEIGKKLPNLHVLKLCTDSCQGSSWILEDGSFPNLVYLVLCDLSIEEFDVSSCDDPLPCLERLFLGRCMELGEIPSVFGEINTLKEIVVYKCSKELEASARRIFEEQREFGNDSLQVNIHRD